MYTAMLLRNDVAGGRPRPRGSFPAAGLVFSLGKGSAAARSCSFPRPSVQVCSPSGRMLLTLTWFFLSAVWHPVEPRASSRLSVAQARAPCPLSLCVSAYALRHSVSFALPLPHGLSGSPFFKATILTREALALHVLSLARRAGW